jgi:ankyrin repeat protein
MDAQDAKFGDTALTRAVKAGHIDEVKSLLGKGANKELTDKWGRTPLIWAARQNYIECLQALIEGGAALDTVDKYGQSAYNWAASSGHDSCAQALIDADCAFLQNHESEENITCMAVDNIDANIPRVLFASFARESARKAQRERCKNPLLCGTVRARRRWH